MLPLTPLYKLARDKIMNEINCLDKGHNTEFHNFIQLIRQKLLTLKQKHTYIYYTLYVCGCAVVVTLMVFACIYCLPLVTAILI